VRIPQVGGTLDAEAGAASATGSVFNVIATGEDSKTHVPLSKSNELADSRKPKDAISRISGLSGWHNRAGDLREMLLADLAAAGVLRLEEGRVLGVFRTTAWKPGDTAIESSLVGRVRSALLDGTPPDDRTAALISILHAIDLLPGLLPDADKRAIRRRGKEISESDWGAAAVRKAVQEVQTVMVAIIVTTTVAASAASS
jgi:hypothetical protein